MHIAGRLFTNGFMHQTSVQRLPYAIAFTSIVSPALTQPGAEGRHDHSHFIDVEAEAYRSYSNQPRVAQSASGRPQDVSHAS